MRQRRSRIISSSVMGAIEKCLGSGSDVSFFIRFAKLRHDGFDIIAVLDSCVMKTSILFGHHMLVFLGNTFKLSNIRWRLYIIRIDLAGLRMNEIDNALNRCSDKGIWTCGGRTCRGHDVCC